MTVTFGITASDGVNLAVHRYTEINTARPTILAIHGWPDNHHIWDAVAEEFCGRYAGRYNFVAFDVRGAGELSRPAKRSGYAFRPREPECGAGVDGWGMGKACSFASIPGPPLEYWGPFLRSGRTPKAVVQVAKQLIGSAYIG